MKPAPAPRVIEWLDEHFPDCAISSWTVLELHAALVLLEHGKRKQALEGAIVRSLRRVAGGT